jgi:hypothetical protein
VTGYNAAFQAHPGKYEAELTYLEKAYAGEE